MSATRVAQSCLCGLNRDYSCGSFCAQELLDAPLHERIRSMYSEKRGPISCWFLLILCCLPTTARPEVAKPKSPRADISTSEVVLRVKKSLVLIVTKDSRGETVAEGSGFFISPSLVLTNLHVMKRASEASVKLLSEDVSYKVASVPEFTLTHDLCVLSVPDARGIPLVLDSNDAVSVGDDILVGGNPEGLEASFSKGIVSAVRKERGGLIQIDAPISPGSSGGPVVNRRGEVIGVAEASLVEGQNLNFAVPITFLRTDMLSGHEQSVWAIGRLSVAQREIDGFQGLVKSVEERHSEYSYSPGSGRYIEGPSELASGKKYNPEGRLAELDFFSDGVETGRMVRDYSSEGLIKRVTEIDGNGKSDGGKEYPVDTAIMVYGMNNPIDETREYGDKQGPDYQVQKYDIMGRQIELGFPNKGIRYLSRFDPHGREIEQSGYKNGKLDSVERFTYEDNSHGDWIKKHGELWSSKVPSLGFTPYENNYREIQYFDRQ